MNWGKTLSIVMILLSVAASVAYALNKDFRRSIYWAASAILISSVTF